MQKTKSTPLKKAAENGHTQTVKRLLEGGANRNYQDKVRKHTKLHSLLLHEVVHGLFIHISPPCVQSERSALYYATRNKHAEIVSLLVQDDAVDDDICTEVCTVYVCVCVCAHTKLAWYASLPT